MKNWLRAIKKMGACEEALKWWGQYDTIEEAWAKCKRGDRMLWLVGNLSGAPGSDGRKKLVLTTCECVRLSLPYVKEGDPGPLKMIETAEKWASGDNNVTLGDVRKAAYATFDPYAILPPTYLAAHAGCVVAFTADAAAYAADAAAYASCVARRSILWECADIVRKHYEAPKMGGKR